MQKEVHFLNLNKKINTKERNHIWIFAVKFTNVSELRSLLLLPAPFSASQLLWSGIGRSKMGCFTSHYVEMAHCHLAILCYFFKIYLQFMLKSNFLFILHPFWNKFYFSFCNVISICWLWNIILHNYIYCKKSLREKNLLEKSNGDKTWTESNIGIFTVLTMLSQGDGLCYKRSWNTVTISILSKHTSSRQCVSSLLSAFLHC